MGCHRALVAGAAALALLASSCSDDVPSVDKAHEAPHWSYEGEHGPEAWGSLDAAYEACSKGVAQSPVDLGAATAAALPELVVDYASTPVSIADNGHTVQASVTGGTNAITVDGTRFSLLQMHFHTPSEHTIDGEFAPAEVHFVHRSDAGELAVIGVMLVEGAQRHEAWDVYTQAAAGGADATLDWPALLPTQMSTVRYAGSLTTPPCTEGVRWMVMDTPVALAAEQLEALAAAHEGNHRPVQSLNDRAVLTDTPQG